MRNKTTNIYTEWLPLIETLSDNDAGIIFKNILLYQNGNDVNCNNPIWLFIKNKIDSYNQDKRNKSNKRAEAGRLGGLAKASNAKQNVANDSKLSIKENKIKENKIKEDKSFLNEFVLGSYKDIWNVWLNYKSSILKDKYKSLRGEQTVFRQLQELSNGDVNIAEQIVNQSMDNEWKGLFELKAGYKPKVTQTTISKEEEQERERKLAELKAKRLKEKQNGNI